MSKLWPVGVPGIASLFGGIGFGKGGPSTAATEQEGEGQEEKKEEETKVEEIKEVSFYLFLGSFFEIIKRVVHGFCYLFKEDCI